MALSVLFMSLYVYIEHIHLFQIKQMRIFILLFLLHFMIPIMSQEIKILAYIKGIKQEEINGDAILLDSNANGIVVNYIEKGNVIINTSYKGNVELQLHVTSYSVYKQSLYIENENLILDTIQLNIQNLQTVEIVGRKNLYEKTSDGFKINIENTILSKSANSAELLSKTPMITVVSGKVQVFGRGEALLILDGRVITYENFLSLAPGDIKSIEINTNPDVRYDAKGKAIIIITMQKYYTQGVRATIVNATTCAFVKNKTFGSYCVNAPNVSIDLRKKNWDFNLYYANEYGTSWAENRFETSTSAFRKPGYYTEDNHSNSVHFYRMGLGYKLSENASISAQYDGLSHYFMLDVIQNGNYLFMDSTLLKIKMTNDATTRLQNHSANVNYLQKFAKQAHSLFVAVQFNQFQNKLLDQIIEKIDSQSYNRINDNLNRIRIYSGQVDYDHSLKIGSLAIGATFSNSVNDGSIQFLSKHINENYFSHANTFKNKIQYTEMVPSLYINYTHRWKKIIAGIGIRWEHTFAKSKSITNDSIYYSNSYSNLFPAAKISYQVHKNITIRATYAYKINRPLYQDMDPFMWYLDSFTSIQGNVNLKPEYLHQSEMRITYRSYILRYAYTFSKHTISSMLKTNSGFGNPQAAVFTKENIQQRSLHTLAIDVPFDKGNYSGFSTLAMNVYQFKDVRDEYKAMKTSPQFYLYTYHSYTIPKWFLIELTAEVYSGSFDGFTKRKPYYYFSLALSRSFLKNDALQISLLWNDFARTALWAGEFKINTYKNVYNQRSSSNYVRLSITYNLASKSRFNYSNKNINEAEYNRIKK